MFPFNNFTTALRETLTSNNYLVEVTILAPPPPSSYCQETKFPTSPRTGISILPCQPLALDQSKTAIQSGLQQPQLWDCKHACRPISLQLDPGVCSHNRHVYAVHPHSGYYYAVRRRGVGVKGTTYTVNNI